VVTPKRISDYQEMDSESEVRKKMGGETALIPVQRFARSGISESIARGWCGKVGVCGSSPSQHSSTPLHGPSPSFLTTESCFEDSGTEEQGLDVTAVFQGLSDLHYPLREQLRVW